ncbi:hypothetical protein BG005_005382 [Podila minutissima]|nr:hypothetical protein BG005_005382 [Podila minutissima]
MDRADDDEAKGPLVGGALEAPPPETPDTPGTPDDDDEDEDGGYGWATFAFAVLMDADDEEDDGMVDTDPDEAVADAEEVAPMYGP